MTAGHERQHLALLRELDELLLQLREWQGLSVAWKPASSLRRNTAAVLERVQSLRVRLDSPLVVATFGGTGTGKSSLVNALVGEEVTASGRQRPTTRRPVLLQHRDLDLTDSGLNLKQVQVCRLESGLLRDVVLIDCPDPDTSEGDSPGSNLAVLREILPYCDVLLYVTTQQKYRSSRIAEELIQAASGCQLVFIQTHADLDSDIRDDWKRQLDDQFLASRIFLVDSRQALLDQQEGRQPAGEFRSLQRFLQEQLGSSRRLAIRRASLTDLLGETLAEGQLAYGELSPHVDRLREVMLELRDELRAEMSAVLTQELLQNRGIWERRLGTAIVDRWGLSPFSALLRLSSGIGGLLASLSFLRARSSVQMALVGAVQGARWLKGVGEQQAETESLNRLSTLGIPDHLLRSASLKISRYRADAGLDRMDQQSGRELDDLRRQLVRMERSFLGDVGQEVDRQISLVAERLTRPVRRWLTELIFLLYPVFVLLRMGHNFFWETCLAPLLGYAEAAAPLLAVEFYIPALFFLVVWCGTGLVAFSSGLRGRLHSSIQDLADRLAEQQLSEGLYPDLEQECDEIDREVQRLTELRQMVNDFRGQLARSQVSLGSLRISGQPDS
jgi:GTPase SAR1 family protein